MLNINHDHIIIITFKDIARCPNIVSLKQTRRKHDFGGDLKIQTKHVHGCTLVRV